jgi:hypothetical protein
MITFSLILKFSFDIKWGYEIRCVYVTPGVFEDYLNSSILLKALENQLIEVPFTIFVNGRRENTM